MKRYWKLIALVTIVVLTVGTFYVQQSLASNKHPDFVLQKKSGDADAVNNLTLQGSYNTEFAGEDLEITANGSDYASERSIFDRMRGNSEPKIEHLQRDYRNFMRGKGEDSNVFAENQAFVDYADIESDAFDYQSTDFAFDVDVLDKKANHQSSFTVTVNGNENYNYVYVEKVFIVDGQLKIITTNTLDRDEEAEKTEMHVYSIAIDSKKMIDDKTVLSGLENGNDDEWLGMNVLSNGSAQDGTDDMVFLKWTEGNEVESSITENVIRYDLKNNQQKELTLPKELQQGANVESVQGTTLYFSERTQGQLQVTAYDRKDNKIVGTQTFDLPVSDDEDDTAISHFKIKGDQLYLVRTQAQKTSVTVANAKSGKTVYEGTVETKGNNTKKKGYELYIYDLLLSEESGDND